MFLLYHMFPWAASFFVYPHTILLVSDFICLYMTIKYYV